MVFFRDLLDFLAVFEPPGTLEILLEFLCQFCWKLCCNFLRAWVRRFCVEFIGVSVEKRAQNRTRTGGPSRSGFGPLFFKVFVCGLLHFLPDFEPQGALEIFVGILPKNLLKILL